MSPLSLRTLLSRLHRMAGQMTLPWPSATPPIVQVDAIWVILILPTGGAYLDRKGRRRPRVDRCSRPIFVTPGIWPDAERTIVLDWIFGASENELQWTAFLSSLEAMGVRGEEGLKLIIRDGGSGLCAAIRTVHFAVPYQRCLFHKLRNIAQAIHMPEALTQR